MPGRALASCPLCVSRLCVPFVCPRGSEAVAEPAGAAAGGIGLELAVELGEHRRADSRIGGGAGQSTFEILRLDEAVGLAAPTGRAGTQVQHRLVVPFDERPALRREQ